ncbi:proteoglycan 4b [Polymixia lowei]
MSSPVLCAIVLVASVFTFTAAQTSCSGRCGAEYYRGYTCQCDYNCLVHDECCEDFESQCTTRDSCKGRCGESFRRGRLCSCDPDCVKYKQCCPDHQTHCDAGETVNGATPAKTSSCDNVNSNKPKEPTVNEQPIVTPPTFNEGDKADDFIPLVTPASDPQDDLNDDAYGQVFPELPYDPYSDIGLEDLEADPTQPGAQDPEVEFIAEETFTPFYPYAEEDPSDNKPGQASASPSPAQPTRDEVPTEIASTSDPEQQSDPASRFESGTPPSPTSSAVSLVSRQPTPSSVPETGPTPIDDTLDLQSGGSEGSGAVPDQMIPEAQDVEPTKLSSDLPGVKPSDPDPENTLSLATTPTMDPETAGPTQGSSSEPNPASPITTTLSPTTSTSVMPDLTPVPEETTPNTERDDSTNAPTVTTPSPSDPQDPNTNDSQDPGSERRPEPSPESGARGDTPDSWNGPDDVTPGQTTIDGMKVTPAPTKPSPSKPPSKPQAKPSPSSTRPSLAQPTSKPKPKPIDPAVTLNIDNTIGYQADDSNDTNLCSGRPASAVTTLGNGTMVVFRGHYFWTLDRYRVPGPAQGITDVWGVPSPIDTAFTRCNCQGKTYILKGSQYWRFNNDLVDPGYPKLIQTGFDGLRGHITAALSVPQYQSRKESVYFFKRGGMVQKYAYQFGTSPTCGRKVYNVRSRVARQAVSLETPVNIRVSWRGFPSAVTSAVSIPSRLTPEGYKYYVFSRSKFHNVRMDGGRPAVVAPRASASPPKNSANDFFKCPKKV